MEFTDAIHDQYKNMVYSVAWNYTNDPILWNDLTQEGMIGLNKACLQYDLNCGVKFSTYAWQKIQGQIIQYLQYNVDVVHIPKSHKLRCYTEELQEISYFSSPDITIDVENAINSLGKRMAEIIRMVLVDGMTRKEVAKKTGINYETLKPMVREAVAKLRSKL